MGIATRDHVLIAETMADLTLLLTRKSTIERHIAASSLLLGIAGANTVGTASFPRETHYVFVLLQPADYNFRIATTSVGTTWS